MRPLLAAIAAVAITALPASALAQRHGGGGWHGAGGGWHGMSGTPHAAAPTGGVHGQWVHGHGFQDFHHFHHFGHDRIFFVGFFPDPWFWGWPGYGWYDCWWDDPWCYGPAYPPPRPAPAPDAGPDADELPPAPTACGAWRWDERLQTYEWVASRC